ncbi:MAG: phosphatase PAP2 family protein [Deltaproteobacteria bacterium]|nr:phosphatase PAP2 family protein [Deltaproteobacteria bacterium]
MASDPKDSSDRGRKLVSIEVNPPAFTIHANTVFLTEAYWQLRVTGHLANNCGTVDLTSVNQGTNYTTSDSFTCNFGAEDGRVFAAKDGTGTCTITADNSGFSATAIGVVTTFAPTALTFINLPGATNNVDVNGNFAYVATGAAGLQVVDVTNHNTPVIVGSVDTPGNANDVVVVGGTAFVADGPSGLQIIDITDPHKPFLRSSVDTPGDAQDVVVKGTLAFVADGSSGLQVIDVSNLDAPIILGAVDTPGAGWGVDATSDGRTAVVADGTSGLQIVNTADPKNPVIIGTLPGGDAQDVVVRGNFAFVADIVRSFTSVDISDPTQPVLKASTDPSLGGRLYDATLAGRFAFGADVYFVDGVPILDVSTPAAPAPRAILNFNGDETGLGIAGHAAIAGACVTVLKAFFNESFVISNPLVASPDGLSLTLYKGSNLTVGGELNKLAANIALARNTAGVHWRSDGIEGLKLGEAVALGILRDLRTTWRESFSGFSFTSFAGASVTI